MALLFFKSYCAKLILIISQFIVLFVFVCQWLAAGAPNGGVPPESTTLQDRTGEEGVRRDGRHVFDCSRRGASGDGTFFSHNFKQFTTDDSWFFLSIVTRK